MYALDGGAARKQYQVHHDLHFVVRYTTVDLPMLYYRHGLRYPLLFRVGQIHHTNDYQ